MARGNPKGKQGKQDPRGAPANAAGPLPPTAEQVCVRAELKSELRLTQFSVEHSKDAVFWMDPQSRIVYANQAACRSLGYSREELLSLSIADIDPLFPKEAWEKVWKEVKTGHSVTVETQHRTKQGTIFPVEITATFLEFEGKEYSFSSARDITERKKAEAALRESEERFRTTFENAGIGMAIVDMEGHPVKCNPALEKMLGYSQEKLSSMVFTEYTHPDDQKRDWELYGELLEGKRDKYAMEKRFIKQDGQVLWGLITVSLVRNAQGVPQCCIGMLEDITERKRKEIELGEREAELAAAQRLAQVGSWQWNIPADEATWSDETFRIFGRAPGPLERHSSSFPEMIHPDDQARVGQALIAALDGMAEYDLQYRLVRPDGIERIIHAQAEVLRDQAGRPTLMRGTVHDITERKQAEEALRRSEARLKEALLAAQMGVWEWLQPTDAVTWDANLFRMTGRDPKLPAPSFREHSQIFAPESWERLKAAVENGLAAASPYELDLELVRPDGKKRWLVARGEPLRDACGHITRLRGTVQDITERKQAEEALRESETRLQAIFDSVQTGIFIIDPATHQIVDANHVALETVGAERALALGAECHKFICPADKGKCPVTDLGQTVDKSERILLAAGGQERTVLKTVVPVAIAGREHLLESFIDVTERKRSEVALGESQALLNTIINSTSDMVWSVDAQSFGLLWFNQSLIDHYQAIGVGIKEGMRPEDLSPDEGVRQEWHDLYQRAIREGPYTIEYSTRIGAKTLQLSLNPLRREGVVFGVSVFGKDITQRKRAEAELADRLRFETLLADLSARFVNVPAGKLDSEIEDALRRVCECLELEVASLWHRSVETSSLIALTHVYRALDGPPFPERMDAPEYFPWTYQQILAGKVVAISSLEQLPPEAARDRETCCQLGLQAGLTIGLTVGGGPPAGALSFNTMRAKRTWPEEVVNRLQLVAQIFSNVLARQQAEAALRERESVLRLFVRHSPAAIAMLDREMRYLVVSRRWVADFRLPTRDVHGVSHYEVFPETPDRWKEVYLRCLAGAVESCEEDPFLRQDGSLDWVRWEVRPWRRVDASIGGIIIFSEMITERKQVREDLQRSLDQLRALAGRLQSVREEERKRLAREIHDQLGQALTALRFDFNSLLIELPGGLPLPSKRASSILKLFDETIQSVRRIATELRPGMLDDLGLVATVEWAGEDFEQRTGIKCRLDLPQEDITMDSELATAIFRILQETLTNVVRHAAANEVEVRLAQENGVLILEVRDNGIGIAEPRLSSRTSLGILGMRERALLAGGELNISSAPGKGTTVRVQIPQTRLP